ncbi:MAG TPA: hypothetical protein VN578_06215 [Candidatus Binatia bacterium]|jgi:hypothetical protein|nr:hypothetical protein [Candidatus Binatia bacterium]
MKMNVSSIKVDRAQRSKRARSQSVKKLAGLVMAGSLATAVLASENEPRRPFAQMADVPTQGQLLFGVLYEQSEAYYAWQGNQRVNITVHSPDGQSYGIDIRQGYFTLDYGLTERWAADLNLGATTVGWRSFDPGGGIAQTTGMMDVTFGVRYQIFNEAMDTNCPWMPTLTFRAGGIAPGIYDRRLPFAPGNHGAAIEPSVLFRKHLGWPGFGVWGDLLYRWEHTNGNDQYITALGVFQQIKAWELDLGWRHLQATSGEDIVFIGNQAPFNGIVYQSDTREISDSLDAGFSYTTKRHIRYGFHARKTFDGRNTDSKLWLGASVDIPFGGKAGK